MPHLRFNPLRNAAIVAVLLTAACSSGGGTNAQSASSAVASTSPSATARVYDPQALPAGPLGASIKLGHDIFADPQKYVPKNVTADMSCASCHIAEGTVSKGGTLVGAYARFPQWNKRAKRVIALQDRLAECFLYSMNGTPPSYTSKEMIAMTAYIAYISRKVPVGTPRAASDRFFVATLPGTPDVHRGQTLYAQKCSACHQASGAGIHGKVPPLWGPTSFNSGAGMADVHQMTGFVRYNMPAYAPGSLSLQDAYDIASWVLTHPRPKFNASRVITSSPEPGGFF